MQAITHFFSGIFMTLLLQVIPMPGWLRFVLLFPIGIMLHFIIDAIAKMTYHPPEPLTKDKFWVTWHVIIFGGSVFVAIWFWVPYFWGMLASIVPDIYDWGIIRGVRAYQKHKLGDNYENKSEFMKGHEFHPWVDKFRNKYLEFLPNWNFQKKGIIPELVIWSACIFAVIILP